MRLPFKHQIEAARHIHQHFRHNGYVRCLVSDPPGAGKTQTSLLYAARHPELRPVLVVCPASVKWQWRREAMVAIGERAEVLDGTKPSDSNILTAPPITVINYDILGPWMDWLLAANFKLLIGDEVQYICDPKSARSRSFRKLAHFIPAAIGLSGTPLLNKPKELWHILNCLRPDLYPSFWKFGFRFCSPKKIMGHWTFDGAQDLDILHAALKSQLLLRRQREEYIAVMPTKMRHIVPLDLSNPADYKHAETDLIGWLAKNAPGKMAKASKAEGLVKIGVLKRLAARLKMPAVINWIRDWLAGNEGKLIVFGVHRDIVGDLHKHWNHTSVLVNGSVTGHKRQLAVEKFQKDSKCRLFFGNIKAAGVGLNLTAAHTVAFVELGWHSAEHLQAEDRAAFRVGDMHGVDVHYLLGKETLEIEIARIIKKKSAILNAVLDGGKAKDRFDVFHELVRKLRRKAA